MFWIRKSLRYLVAGLFLGICLRGLWWTAVIDGSRLYAQLLPMPIAPVKAAEPMSVWSPPQPDRVRVVNVTQGNNEVIGEIFTTYAFTPATFLDFVVVTEGHAADQLTLYITNHAKQGMGGKPDITQVVITHIQHVHLSAPPRAQLALHTPP